MRSQIATHCIRIVHTNVAVDHQIVHTADANNKLRRLSLYVFDALHIQLSLHFLVGSVSFDWFVWVEVERLYEVIWCRPKIALFEFEVDDYYVENISYVYDHNRIVVCNNRAPTKQRNKHKYNVDLSEYASRCGRLAISYMCSLAAIEKVFISIGWLVQIFVVCFSNRILPVFVIWNTTENCSLEEIKRFRFFVVCDDGKKNKKKQKSNRGVHSAISIA